MFASIQDTLVLRMERWTWARIWWSSSNQYLERRSKTSIEDPRRQAKSSRHQV